MGTNLNLCEEWGAPVEEECPSCHERTHTPFEEYDVEVARQVGNDLHELPTVCMHCEHEWNFVWAARRIGKPVRLTRTETLALMRTLQLGLSTPGAPPLSQHEQKTAENAAGRIAQLFMTGPVEIAEAAE